MSWFHSKGQLYSSANSSSPYPCSWTRNFHSFTTVHVQGRTEQTLRFLLRCAGSPAYSCPAPRRLGLLDGHQEPRGTHSASVPLMPSLGKRLAPPGGQGALRGAAERHPPAAPERSQTRNRVAVGLPPEKARHAGLHRNPADPTFTLRIAVGVAPE